MFDQILNLSYLWMWILHIAAFAGVLLALVLISQILRTPRIPSATMGWLFVIMFVPIAGIPLYLFFGERKIHTRMKLKGQLELPDLPDNYEHSLNTLLVSLGIPSASNDNLVHFHDDGEHAWQALLQMLDGAQDSIDIAIFILADDHIGARILSLLEDKAAHGVKIRLLLDGIGSFSLPKKRLLPLTRQGGQVAWFIPVLHQPLRGRTNLRNHRKIIIVDSEKIWAGGRNFTATYLGSGSHQQNWIDLSFSQQGSVVSTYVAIFDADWYFAARKALPGGLKVTVIPATGKSRVQVIPSGPDVADDPIYVSILTACYNARKRIMVVTPYYIPDNGIQEALKLAALRGVVVELLLPEKSNHPLADIARRRYLRELDKVGVKIWFIPHAMVHAKSMIFDNTFAMAGSANLDIRSLFLNCEVMSGFYSETEIRWLTHWFEKLRNRAIRHYPQPVGAFREMIEGLTLLGAYQL